ncbi:tyrosine-type recombinase/integrase [Pseudoalteromonas maricaloris]|uniref:tyrosine-type recombinase/integrase n=1 Tax=Pseudoalteromonas maricaloris TaxID=184924 RepID=UPI003C1DE5D7
MILRNTTKTKIIKTSVNFGKGMSFHLDKSGQPIKTEKGIRTHSYRHDKIEPNFPVLYHPTRFTECQEMNLFLMHRFEGHFSLKKNQIDNEAFSDAYHASQPGKPLDVKSVRSIAKHLKAFLDWLDKDGASYFEVIAAPLSKQSVDDEISRLPVWRYHEHLCERIETKDKSKRISFNSAQERIRAVKAFYIWSHKRGAIDSLPFSLEYKQVRIKTKAKSGVSSLFQLPTSNTRSGGLWKWVSNLSIPNTLKQKEDSPEKDLQPYSPKELKQLLETDTAQKETYKLYLQCALLGGLRSFEISAIDQKDLFDPDEKENEKRIPKLNIVRKGHKPVRLTIARVLMKLLYNHTLTIQNMKRRTKHETNHGMDNSEHPLPLFMNSSGSRISEDTPGNTISIVRKEQRKQGLEILLRTFHDLRATFATYVAKYLIDKGESESSIRQTLMTLMSHESFKTTKRYIDFAKSVAVDAYGAMSEWVKDIYGDVDELLMREAEDAAAS